MLRLPADLAQEGALVISPELLEDIEVVAEDTGETESPFVRVRRLRLRHRYTDGQYSAAYSFDLIEGPFADAVAIVLYYIDSEARVWVKLCSLVNLKQKTPSIHLDA